MEDLIANEDFGMVEVRKLKLGDFFMRRPLSVAYSKSILVRGPYDPTRRLYSCHYFDDINHEVFLKPLTQVFIRFEF